MLVVSFHTPTYTEHAKRLRESCEKHGLRYWIEPMKDQGSWEANCAKKPSFILKAMRASGEPVLWLDADAVVERDIAGMFDFLPDAQPDFACWHNPKAPDKIRFRSGTVWLNQTPMGYRLATAWAGRCYENPQTWDQEHLFHAWNSIRSGLKEWWLDVSYSHIFDEDDGCKPHITHYQASRELKHA